MAGRYRIVALVGHGGMGEVYRAEDIVLEQTVALKFLPEDVSHNPERLAMLRREVRVARQVSHPHVCRVYDIGEADGHRFLSMEYVDGEDLASLLRRVGHLPQDKGVDLAQQLCAGLSAVHAKALLHRDLKPSNVLIDGRGQVKLVDFGIADAGEAAGDIRPLIGTPAYLAPELFAGEAPTVRSDIYALGLILYEIFTGQPAFVTATREEAERAHLEREVTRMSAHVGDLDPIVETVVHRCLAKEPAARPTSVLAVAAALPGSADLLAEAIRRGDTPSPELVAASGGAGMRSPRWAAAALALIAIALFSIIDLAGRAGVLQRLPALKRPEVLRDRAEEVVRAFGYQGKPAASASGFWRSNVGDLEARLPEGAEFEKAVQTGEPPLLLFWYRQSPRPMPVTGFASGGRVSWNEPYESEPGMVNVNLDPAGRLQSFQAVPATRDHTATARGAPPDWAATFREAGLDLTRFHSAATRWPPRVYADTRAAWDGVSALRADVPLHVEAAAFEGRIVSFDVDGPWREANEDRAERQFAQPMNLWSQAGWAVLWVPVIGAGFLAARNIRRGRGDRRAARRMAAAVLLTMFVSFWLRTDFSQNPAILIYLSFANGLFFAGLAWVAHIAIEPHIRRRWPGTLISWNRLLLGRWRDSLVGRDLLVGVVFGTLGSLIGVIRSSIAPNVVNLQEWQILDGARFAAGRFLISAAVVPLISATEILLIFFFAVLILRSRAVAAVVLPLLVLLTFTGFVNDLFFAAEIAIFSVVLLRFGFLSLFVANAVGRVPSLVEKEKWRNLLLTQSDRR